MVRPDDEVGRESGASSNDARDGIDEKSEEEEEEEEEEEKEEEEE